MPSTGWWVRNSATGTASASGGSSFSGGHVVYVAARDPRVRAFVSQVGSMDGRWVLGPTLKDYTFSQGTARAQGKIAYPKPFEKFGSLTGAPVIEKFMRSEEHT